MSAWWSSGGVALLALERPWHLHHRCTLSLQMHVISADARYLCSAQVRRSKAHRCLFSPLTCRLCKCDTVVSAAVWQTAGAVGLGRPSGSPSGCRCVLHVVSRRCPLLAFHSVVPPPADCYFVCCLRIFILTLHDAVPVRSKNTEAITSWTYCCFGYTATVFCVSSALRSCVGGQLTSEACSGAGTGA